MLSGAVEDGVAKPVSLTVTSASAQTPFVPLPPALPAAQTLPGGSRTGLISDPASLTLGAGGGVSLQSSLSCLRPVLPRRTFFLLFRGKTSSCVCPPTVLPSPWAPAPPPRPARAGLFPCDVTASPGLPQSLLQLFQGSGWARALGPFWSLSPEWFHSTPFKMRGVQCRLPVILDGPLLPMAADPSPSPLTTSVSSATSPP